jgi:hypothetical protein
LIAACDYSAFVTDEAEAEFDGLPMQSANTKCNTINMTANCEQQEIASISN